MKDLIIEYLKLQQEIQRVNQDIKLLLDKTKKEYDRALFQNKGR